MLFLKKKNQKDDFVALPKGLDEYFVDLLKSFDHKGFLKNTLLLVLSDHGVRSHKFMYETEIGYSEKYSPYLSVRSPQFIWNSQFEVNLRANKQRLVSFFDLHSTLGHFLNINSSQSIGRGKSLLSKIPQDRSCKDAQIPDQQCRCNEHKYLTENEFKLKTKLNSIDAANLIVNNLNDITRDFRFKCLRFRYNEIKAIYNSQLNDPNVFKFKLKLQPGHTWFEASVKVINGNMTLNDTINRLSIYWKTSECMNIVTLKPFCYCFDLLKNLI
jgi:hypothetical protein